MIKHVSSDIWRHESKFLLDCWNQVIKQSHFSCSTRQLFTHTHTHLIFLHMHTLSLSLSLSLSLCLSLSLQQTHILFIPHKHTHTHTSLSLSLSLSWSWPLTRSRAKSSYGLNHLSPVPTKKKRPEKGALELNRNILTELFVAAVVQNISTSLPVFIRYYWVHDG
jgi:hypothetical protein